MKNSYLTLREALREAYKELTKEELARNKRKYARTIKGNPELLKRTNDFNFLSLEEDERLMSSLCHDGE